MASLPECVRGAYLGGSQSREETASVVNRLTAGQLDLLYVAPERLMVSRFVKLLRGVTVPLVAVDEAHCVALWSHNFRPSYMRLRRVLHKTLRVPTVLALTATATRATQQSLCHALGLAVVRDVVVVEGCDNVEQACTPPWRTAFDAATCSSSVTSADATSSCRRLLDRAPRQQWPNAQVVRQPAVRRNLQLNASRESDRHAALIRLLTDSGPLASAKSVIVYATMKVKCVVVVVLLFKKFYHF